MIRAPDWIREYIGIPYVKGGYSRVGCHCWGLVCLVQSEKFGRKLLRHDEFTYSGRHDARRAGAVVKAYLQVVAEDWYQIDQAEVDLGDVLILRLLGQPIHTAVAVSDTHMLHQQDGCDSVCEAIFSLLWENRIESVWRHYSVQLKVDRRALDA
jgi:cell wall-associated NlpC family hydrolase